MDVHSTHVGKSDAIVALPFKSGVSFILSASFEGISLAATCISTQTLPGST